MIVSLIIIFALPVLLSLILTPAAKWLAKLLGAIDTPNQRKIHSKSTPRLGGTAVFGSFLLTLALMYLLFPELYLSVVSDSAGSLVDISQGILIMASLALVLIVGAWDDIYTLKPGPKFAVQFVAASLIYLAGFNISSVTNPAGPGVLDLQMLSYPLTVLWIVGITNAFNLIDGLDGLASGVAAIALVTIVAISLVHQQMGTAVAALILAGATLGFLWFNFRPATIFLGDSGSLFLGFSLALLSIQSFTKVSTTFATLIPVFALGLPILDTSLSMFRRFFSWFMPEKDNPSGDFTFRTIIKSIFLPDKSHIHHRLINRGLSHKNTVLVLYSVSALFCLGAFLVSVTDHLDTTILVVFFALIIIKTGVGHLRYKEINLLHNGIFFTLYNHFIINKRYFRKVLDSMFVLISFAGSYYLLYPVEFTALVHSHSAEATLVAGSIFSIQMGAFWLSGLYKKTIRQLGIADVIKILKSVGLAVIITMLVYYIFFNNLLQFSLLLFVIDFYFLVTLVLGIRVSFHILKYLFYKSRKSQQRVLIYGAGEQGTLALRQILSIDPQRYTPVGFLDEDPNLEGKLVNGYPVFGGHWKLERLVRSKNVDKLLITDHQLHSKIIQQLYTIAHRHSLDIQLIRIQLKDLKLYSENGTRGESVSYVN